MKQSLIKSPHEIEVIARSGEVTAAVLKFLAERAKIGTRLRDLDTYTRELVREFSIKTGADVRPAFLGYHPYGAKRAYPAALCTSVNDVIVHGCPGEYRVQEGDLLKLDFGVIFEGFYSDAALTVPIGEVSLEARELIAITREALARGIAQALPGNRLGDIGWAIEHCVRTMSNGRFSVVEGLTGHGVGYALHEDPSVYNSGTRGKGLKLEPGMVLALEPMVSAGSPNILQRSDDSFATADGSLSAHFEHTIVITEKVPRILTAME